MRFAVLDGWRGVCALVVALHHFYADGHFFHVPLIRGAWLFVDFFFVLSGFVIAHTYGKRIAAPSDLLVFLGRRFARLWPLHAAVLLALVALEAAKALAMAEFGVAAANPPFAGETAPQAVATNLLLVHALGIHAMATWNFPSWSISTEFWTYLVFALLCLTRFQRERPVLLAIALLGATIVALYSAEWLHTIADYSFFRCLYGFFLGALVYRLLAGRLGRPLPAATLLEAGVVALVVLFVSQARDKTALSMAVPPVFAAAIAVFAFSQGLLSRLLATTPARALGKWSYSIYLIHTLLLVVIGRAVSLAEAMGAPALTSPYEVNGATRVLLTLGDAWLNDAAAAGYLIVVVAVSALTWRWIERPCQSWIEARLPGRVAADRATKA